MENIGSYYSKGIINDVNPIINETIDLMPNIPFIESSCNCLPPCQYYQYTAQMVQGQLKYNDSTRTQFYL